MLVCLIVLSIPLNIYAYDTTILNYNGRSYDLSNLEDARDYFDDSGSFNYDVDQKEISRLVELVTEYQMEREKETVTKYQMSVIDNSYDLESKMKTNADVMKGSYFIAYQAASQQLPTHVQRAAAAYIAVGFTFAKNVKIGGIWDLKKDLGAYNEKTFVSVGGRYTYLFNDDIGNIHYGYVGKTYFSKTILLSAAGLVQLYGGESNASWWSSYFDDPRDQIAIKAGIIYYDGNEFPFESF